MSPPVSSLSCKKSQTKSSSNSGTLNRSFQVLYSWWRRTSCARSTCENPPENSLFNSSSSSLQSVVLPVPGVPVTTMLGNSPIKMSLWQKVVQESARNKRRPEGTLILAGSERSGAKTLLQQLRQGPGSLGKHSRYSQLIQDHETYDDVTSPIHYFYLNGKNIEDPQSELISKINVWLLDQPKLKDLLDGALSRAALSRTIFGIVLDWEHPWRFLEELTTWMGIWNEKVGKALSALPVNEQDERTLCLENYVRMYREPDAAESAGSSEELPRLPEGVLGTNFGVPIVVICCKSDLVWGLDRNREQNEKVLDFVLKALREFCISYGASLIYTSAKKGTNLQVLYDYLIHRIYGFKSPHKTQVLNREEIFIAAGWDSPQLIKEMSYPEILNKQYHEMLPQPKLKVEPTEEIKVISDQEFLVQMKGKLESNGRPRRTEVKKPLEINPGGEIILQETVVESARGGGQHTLDNFYKDLLSKGKDASK